MTSSGMMVSPHPLATQAGQSVLDAGGDAISASIAVNAVLCVVCPHFCGLGGDAVWMVSDGNGTQDCFLGLGQGIEDGRVDGPIPARGARSVLTSAAAVSSWQHALEYASDRWEVSSTLAELLAPAIALATNGHAVSPSHAHWLTFREADRSDWPGFETLFIPNGNVPEAGSICRQPELAESLNAIAQNGADEFYTGGLARRMIDGLRAHGARINMDDLAATLTRTVDPVQLEYRGATLMAPPPPTQGMTTLEIMGILRHFDFSQIDEDSSEHLHLVVEAVKCAFVDRHSVSDPEFCDIDYARFLSDDHLEALSKGITANARSWPETFQPADTVYSGVVDGQGRCASVLHSTYFDWGSGVVAGDTGILWQNRGAAFHHDPAHPNGYRPGKLPFYTLNPGLALKEGRPWLLYGTQGADGQPQTLAMLLTRLIDYARSPKEALAAGRFLLGRTFSDSQDNLKLEDQFTPTVIDELSRRGHEVALLTPWSPLAGQAGVIRIDNGVPQGAHDPRD